MITEALLDKIKALISGYKQPAHPLYGKSDKEVARIMKNMVSRYLTESKQEILKEAEITSFLMNPVDISGPYSKSNVRLVEKAMDKYGITNSYTRIAILSVIAKESKFKPRGEISYANTSNSRIREVFGNNKIYYDIPELNLKKGDRFRKLSNAQIDKLKSNPKKFFDTLYGGRYKNAPDEGYKYRGRGFNQITFKSAYERASKRTGLNLVANPDLLNKPIVAAMASVAFLKNRLRQKFGASLGNFKNQKQANIAVANANAGWGKERGNDSLERAIKLTSSASDSFKYSGLSTTDSLLRPGGSPETEPIADLKPKKKMVSDPDLGSAGQFLVPTMKMKRSVNVTTTPNTDKETEIDTQRPQTISQLPLLRRGTISPDVENIQRKLLDLYGPEILPKDGADGRFGKETLQAVKKFQRDHKLTVDGIVGPMTYKTLYKYFPTVVVNKDVESNSDDLADTDTDDLTEMIHTSTLYRKIFKEEAQRAQRLLFEYNEEKTWQSMTTAQKEQALLSVDDDLGPDLADEYSQEEWLKIPDVITNRIDLQKYSTEKPDRQSSMFTRSLIRGINNRAKEDANAAKFVKAYLGKTLANRVEDLTSQQVKDLMDKLHAFQASLSKFVPPTPEQEADSARNMATWINQDRIDNPGFSRD